jgi:nicotinamidase-related amidase
MKSFRLLSAKTGVLVVDIQERLVAAMEPAAYARMLRRVAAVLTGARALGLPLVVTEQYPKGLGPTVAPVREALPEGAAVVEKIHFSAALDPVFRRLPQVESILVVGMETHVCVFQTARDLAERGYTPHVLADAVLSRAEEDRQVGLQLCRDVGSVVSTVESALFDLLGRAGTPEFKQISTAVKER